MAFQARTDALTRWEKEDAIALVMRALAKAYPVNTVKLAANDLETSYRTTEKWAKGAAEMSLHEFFNACKRIPHLKAAAMEALEMGEMDPDFARAINDLLRAAMKARP